MTKVRGVALHHAATATAHWGRCSSCSSPWSIVRVAVVPADAPIAASALEAVVQHPRGRVVAVGATRSHR